MALDELPEYDARTVAEHKTAASSWVVIDGLVYDVTHFHHPGGVDRILGLAGSDITQAFLAVGHRTEKARFARELSKLRVGRLVETAAGEAGAPALEKPKPVGFRDATDRRSLMGGSDHRPSRAGDNFWGTRCRGFLPARDPTVSVGEPYTLLLELVAMLPTALADRSFRDRVSACEERFEPLRAAIEAEPCVDVLERVHSLYGYIGKGYVHGRAEADGAQSVPSFISEGWLAVSAKLGRHPTIDYADCVLNNWQRIDPHGPITPENIRLLNRFTGLLDEEWYATLLPHAPPTYPHRRLRIP
jgi:hypothetical protein